VGGRGKNGLKSSLLFLRGGGKIGLFPPPTLRGRPGLPRTGCLEGKKKKKKMRKKTIKKKKKWTTPTEKILFLINPRPAILESKNGNREGTRGGEGEKGEQNIHGARKGKQRKIPCRFPQILGNGKKGKKGRG